MASNPRRFTTGRRRPDAARDGAGEERVDPIRYLIDDQDRYSRLRLISWWRQERLRDARVLVVGAGALGNEVMKNLALLGLGTTYLIDLDVVEPSNLSRSVLFREQDGGQSQGRSSPRGGPASSTPRSRSSPFMATSSPISDSACSPTSIWSLAASTIARPGSGSTGSAGRPALPGSMRASRRFRGWSRSSSRPTPPATNAP